MNTFDDFLSKKIANDRIDFDIDNSELNHLHYLVNLNSVNSEVKRNSIFSFLSDFLSPQFILAKVAFISILLVLIIGNKGTQRHNNFMFQADSTLIQKNYYDTLSESPSIPINDSLYR